MLFLEAGPQPPRETLVLPPRDALPHYGVEAVYINDFDDNMSYTRAAIDGLVAVCAEMGLEKKINKAAISVARQEAHKRGGSYNVLNMLEERLAPEVMAEVRSRYRAGEGGHLITFDDVSSYTQRLTQHPVTPNFILTHGENVHLYPDGGWQADKIHRGREQGLLPPGFAYFISHSRKGPFIRNLINPRTGQYDLLAFNDHHEVVALYSANTAVQTDDRKTSLQDGPDNCKKLYMRRPNIEPTVKQTEGTLPSDAETITSFDEVEVRKGLMPLNEAAKRAQIAHVAAFVPARLYAKSFAFEQAQISTDAA